MSNELYFLLQRNAEASKLSGKGRRHHLIKRDRKPYVEYTRHMSEEQHQHLQQLQQQQQLQMQQQQQQQQLQQQREGGWMGSTKSAVNLGRESGKKT